MLRLAFNNHSVSVKIKLVNQNKKWSVLEFFSTTVFLHIIATGHIRVFRPEPYSVRSGNFV